MPVILEGSPAVGKSSTSIKIREKLVEHIISNKFQTFKEYPGDYKEGNILVENFRKNIANSDENSAYLFESNILDFYLKTNPYIATLSNDGVKTMCDRWVGSCYGFIKGFIDNGLIKNCDALLRRCENYTDLFIKSCKDPIYIVMLTAEIDTIMERIKRRGRAGEETYTSEELLKIDKNAMDFHKHVEYISAGKVKIVKIDTTHITPEETADKIIEFTICSG